MTFFITVPISFIVGAPISAMTALTPATTWSSLGGLGHVGFDQRDLGGFLVGHLLAPAFGELLDGILALLDQSGQNLLRFLVVERSHLFDLAILERGLDHAESGQAVFVARLHGGDDVFLNLFAEAHGEIIAYWRGRLLTTRTQARGNHRVVILSEALRSGMSHCCSSRRVMRRTFACRSNQLEMSTLVALLRGSHAQDDRLSPHVVTWCRWLIPVN